MKQTGKIFIKSVVLVLFLWWSPFLALSFSQQKISSFASKVFTQNRSVPQIDVTETMNVMNMVKKEDIPYREIDTEKRTEVIPIEHPITDSSRIYIYSTHQGEAYADKGNVVDASKELAKLLRNKGIEVIVEEQNFKKELNRRGLTYDDSYLISRQAINDALVDHGQFDLIIDFHRDSVPRENTFFESEGKSYAKLMCVLGGLSNRLPTIKKTATLLFDKSNEQVHGIMKSLLIREAYYNQDMNNNMILIEVGSDTNTYQEVLNSIEILANAIQAYLR